MTTKDNVTKRDGSKASSRTNTDARGGLAVTQRDGGSAGHSDGTKTSADSGQQRDADYNKGGRNPDVPPQGANQKNAGTTGKRDLKGPSTDLAEGGENKMAGFVGSIPSAPGRTARIGTVDAAGKVDAPVTAGVDHANDPGRDWHGPHAAHGHTVVPANPAHSVGSDTEYPKGDGSNSDGKMPDWHRTRSRGASPRGG